MTFSQKAVVALVAVCLFLIGLILEKRYLKFWRIRRKAQRLARARTARVNRDIEISRQNLASVKNGRSSRTGSPINRRGKVSHRMTVMDEIDLLRGWF